MGSEDVTLTAAWTSNPTYTVTYDGSFADSGTVPADAGSYKPGETVTVKGNTGGLVKAGYVFDGWYDGSAKRAVNVTFDMPSSNVTLYACWVRGYRVLYVGNGSSSGSNPIDASLYKPGDTVTVLGNVGSSPLSLVGYRFAGWLNGSNLYKPGTAASGTFTMPESAVVLAAKWNSTSVYVCGAGTTSQYWINDIGYELSKGGRSWAPSATGISVSGDDVFISGQQLAAVSPYPYSTAVYYKNNSIIRINQVAAQNQASDYNYGCSAILVNDTVLYLCGFKLTKYGYERFPLFWATTTSQTASPSENYLTGTVWDKSCTATGIFISGSDVYYSGSYNSVACYWKNGTKNDLSGTAARSIAVSGSDVFVAGTANDSGSGDKPCYWKNSTRYILNATTAPGSAGAGIAVSSDGSKVHIVGNDSTGKAKHWVYDPADNACLPDETFADGTSATSVFLYGSDVYISGTDGTNACYWKNGVKVVLYGGSSANSIFVK
jgi:uncharacterized repeat protein (TIGR02543 family)